MCSCFDWCWSLQFFWPKVVVRKWLNISDKTSDYSADEDDDSGSDREECAPRVGHSRFKDDVVDDVQSDSNNALPRIRRRKSETFRAQYISTKELRVRVGTWNVGGKAPPEDLDIDDWIGVNDPADIYVLGLQEIVPLNAGNIFGAEDSRPVILWENIIRETLNRIRPSTGKHKSFSDPPSPSKYKPPHDFPDIDEDISLEYDTDFDEEIHDVGEEVHPLNEELEERKIRSGNLNLDTNEEISDMLISPKMMDRLYCIRSEENNSINAKAKLTRKLSGTERIGLSWPEPPLNLLSQRLLERPNSFRTVKSFKSTGSDMSQDFALLAEIDLERLMKRKRRSSYVRIVSKQMVGVFLTVWVRRSLRRHIHNLKVSTVGVGVMGYIGNKGAVSVSMSIYQTLFCFICTHLTSGEREVDKIKRNADVQDIYRRTHFHSHPSIGLPKGIREHERMIWLGDLNYRLNLSYDKTRELISNKKWSELLESDQLVRELRKGRAFGGWTEGTLNFAPTYKYEIDSDKYSGEDPKAVRRIPAWCDRILSYGKGMKQLNYRRTELKLSDHRPVTATYVAEVEEFCPRKLQRALTFTDAEIENDDVVADMGIEAGMSCLAFEQDVSNWER